jgi:nucleotide-binding universal stress UspA family protein
VVAPGPADGPPAGAGDPAPPAPSPFAHVLLAIDVEHPPGERWSEAVREFAARFGSDLVACHVVFRSTSVAGNELDGAPATEEETEIARKVRAILLDRLGEPGRRIPVKLLHGDPGERIAEYAAYLGCDLIVLEAGARSIAHRLKGSVGRFLLGASDRSVLIVARPGPP